VQVRAELNTAEAALATATAERLQLQQELSTKSDQLMLLESELRLKTSRLDAAQQQLSTEAEEHAAERALLQRQLEQLVVSCAVPVLLCMHWRLGQHCITLCRCHGFSARYISMCKPSALLLAT
jgi:uncharacterized protein YhaN